MQITVISDDILPEKTEWKWTLRKIILNGGFSQKVLWNTSLRHDFFSDISWVKTRPVAKLGTNQK